VTRCDGSAGRINAAQELGGPSCLVATVRELSGIPIQHHITVSFGGSGTWSTRSAASRSASTNPSPTATPASTCPPAARTSRARTPLGFVRVRKIDDDLQRIQRQQTFLRALAAEIAAPSTLLNPFRVVSLTNEIGDAITADRRLGPIDLARLALGARGLAGGAERDLDLEVDSAGTGDWHIGELPDQRMRTAAAAVGLQLNSRGRQVLAEDLTAYDLVLAMDRDNLRVLESLRDDATTARIELFRTWDPAAGDDVDVPDPYYGGSRGFDEVVEMCRRTAAALVEDLAAS
jgi:protein-tyrosine phosphatase